MLADFKIRNLLSLSLRLTANMQHIHFSSLACNSRRAPQTSGMIVKWFQNIFESPLLSESL